jgi:hypothetical protein
MNRPKVASIAIDAFYDNFTCAALFRKLRIPGSPEEVIDPRPVRSFWADEFQQILAEAKGRLHVIARVALVGVIVSALRRGDPKGSATEGEDTESFIADWPSFIKP